MREIASDADDKTIAEAIIALGRALDLTVVAEGVETAEQEAVLRAHNCDEVQGYLISRPVPADGLRPFMGNRTRRRIASPGSPDCARRRGENPATGTHG